jgi:hypothetical protein
MRTDTKLTTLLLGVVAVATSLQSQSATDVTAWPNIIPPTSESALLGWLNKGSYKENFIPEPKVHPSPVHGTVRTYYNPIIAGDLHAKRKAFRKGAAMVKELYSNGKVTGYAVMVKALKNTKPAGSAWLFYETFSKTGPSAIFGRGAPECAGCHKKGTDFLLSTFRPYK